MTIGNTPAGPVEASPAAPLIPPGPPPSWPWQQAALFLAGAAQLITVSPLVGPLSPVPGKKQAEQCLA